MTCLLPVTNEAPDAAVSRQPSPHSHPAHGPQSLTASASAQVVPLLLCAEAACRAPQPLTTGIPFPRGLLRGPEDLTLAGPDGESFALQTEVLARWSDDSVKWLLVDCVADRVAQGGGRWRLTAGQERPARQAGLTIQQTKGAVVVDTGAAVFHLNPAAAVPLEQVVLPGGEVIAARGGLTLRDARGRAAEPKVESAAFEARGPVRATLRLEGRFGGRSPCRFLVRVCFFAGTGLVRLRLTLHNPRRARHRGGLWDLGDAGSILFRELAVRLGLATGSPTAVRWAAEPGQTPSCTEGPLEIYQDSSGGENWQSRNHVDRTGRVPCSFRGYRVRWPGGEARGLRANPVVTLSTAAGQVSVAVPEFWQQFPKAVEIEPGLLHVGLWPRQSQGLHELQGGEQKTHTVWMHFGPPAGDGAAALAWVHEPARLLATPDWYAASGAVPYLLPAAHDPHRRLQELLAGALDGPDSFAARRDVIDEYGWRNYGDFYADHEAAHYQGPAPVVSHYNNQYDVVYSTLLQCLRTGDARWLGLHDALARHVIDIDIYHTDRDRAVFSGGLFWHTDHYRDAGTATHRAYCRANAPRPGDRSYGGGPGNTHNYATGLLFYYYRTGDPAGRDAVLSLADWVLAMDDGRQHILGWVEDGPTGLASHNGEPTFSGPGRGSGNSVNVLLDAWLLTGRPRYLDKAEELIRRVVHPDDDVPARDLLNVEPRWSYTVFLSALARYLDLKAEANDLGFMYAYARASLLRYAAWMAGHERPYFDQVEKLEFPTETWAAQEFRKANVMRLAAAHADEPLRSRLLERGEAFAERAWADLLRFPSRTVTRALAIVMMEGSKDAYLRANAPAPAARPLAPHDFGRPQSFVYQKLRVRARLRTLRGICGVVLRLLNPLRWGMVRYWPH